MFIIKKQRYYKKKYYYYKCEKIIKTKYLYKIFQIGVFSKLVIFVSIYM